ncbi:MAG TPA: beta-propeller fold lactonase family protein [Solirubrobacteraceae bacterium]|nr:beta-propeller fold lactonase family protein [Solirubrobacteraceae bacterium]
MGPNAVRLVRLLGLAVAAAALLLLPSSAFAKHHAKSHHHRSHHTRHHDGDHHGNSGGSAVYTTTNDPNGNAVIVFKRNRDGSLTQGPTVPTGGTGIAAQPPFTFPIVDSSGSMALADDGRLLFVVNDGDNTITSFRADGGGLRRVDRVSSGGVLPVSLTTHGHLLYVVNEESSNIAGFYFSDDGRLFSIPGSQQLLSPLFPSGSAPPNAGGVAAQIGFSPDGRQLVVTERGVPSTVGAIDTFAVNPNGSLTLEQADRTASVDPNPFGFAFTRSGNLLVSNVGQVSGAFDYPGGSLPIPQILDPAQFTGSASSYSLSSTGTLTPISTEVLSGGRGACWLVLSKDGKFAFVTNTLSTAPILGPPNGIGTGAGGLTTYRVGSDGTLTRLGQTDLGPGSPTDLAVSSDGKFLYVSDPNVPPPPATSHIDVFRINGDGSLTAVTQGATLPVLISGLAAN